MLILPILLDVHVCAGHGKFSLKPAHCGVGYVKNGLLNKLIHTRVIGGSFVQNFSMGYCMPLDSDQLATRSTISALGLVDEL